MKYQSIFKQLHDQPSTGKTADAVPQWLNNACNIPSFQPSPFTTSSPPATPPRLRKRRKRRDRRPLQPSNDNQNLSHKPLPKRKIADRDDDTIKQSGRQLRRENISKPPVKYQGEEQGPQGQRTRDQVRRSPHKGTKSEGGAIVTTRGLGKGTAQSALQPSIPQPTTPVGGRSRGSGSPEKRQKSPTESSQASDRIGWMAYLDPEVRCLIPEICLKQRKIPDSVSPLWLNYMRSDANEEFIPEEFRVSNSIFVL